jgi:hypothetical protein
MPTRLSSYKRVLVFAFAFAVASASSSGREGEQPSGTDVVFRSQQRTATGRKGRHRDRGKIPPRLAKSAGDATARGRHRALRRSRKRYRPDPPFGICGRATKCSQREIQSAEHTGSPDARARRSKTMSLHPHPTSDPMQLHEPERGAAERPAGGQRGIG